MNCNREAETFQNGVTAHVGTPPEPGILDLDLESRRRQHCFSYAAVAVDDRIDEERRTVYSATPLLRHVLRHRPYRTTIMADNTQESEYHLLMSSSPTHETSSSTPVDVTQH